MDRRMARQCLHGLLAGVLLGLGAAPGAWAGEWEQMRDSLEDKLRPHAKRLEEIEARELGDPADRQERAEKMTRDRISTAKATLSRSDRVRSLPDAAEPGSADATAVADLSRQQGEQLDAVMREWGVAGWERRRLREDLAAVQRNVERANASVARAIEGAESTADRVRDSGVFEMLARVEAQAAEAGEWLRARWQREYAARERERLHRERIAGERERGVR
jgi:hypothetical protein